VCVSGRMGLGSFWLVGRWGLWCRWFGLVSGGIGRVSTLFIVMKLTWCLSLLEKQLLERQSVASSSPLSSVVNFSVRCGFLRSRFIGCRRVYSLSFPAYPIPIIEMYSSMTYQPRNRCCYLSRVCQSTRSEIQLSFPLITYTGSSVTYPWLPMQSALIRRAVCATCSNEIYITILALCINPIDQSIKRHAVMSCKLCDSSIKADIHHLPLSNNPE
jgi:hypothetical protein